MEFKGLDEKEINTLSLFVSLLSAKKTNLECLVKKIQNYILEKSYTSKSWPEEFELFQ